MYSETCTIIVPVLQDSAIFELFLDSLWRTIEVPSQVVLVNDGSGGMVDDLIETYSRRAPAHTHVEHRSSPRPRGCACALNEGLSIAAGEVVIFADSDLVFIPGWQTALLDASHGPNVGAVGGLLIYPQTGGVQHCGIGFSEDICRHLFLNASLADVPRDSFAVQAVVFALCALPRCVVTSVGPVDEQYFNGYEDLDYQMRIGQIGRKIVVQPSAKAYHWERSSGLNRSANRKRNLGRFWRKWGDAITPDLEQHLITRILDVVGQDGTFQGIDLCRERPDALRVWTAIRNNFSILGVEDLSFTTGLQEELWLPQVLGIDGHRTAQRLLFLVDNFVQLLGNRYWIEVRNSIRSDDIIIDLYANVLPIQRLHASCWPGVRIR